MCCLQLGWVQRFTLVESVSLFNHLLKSLHSNDTMRESAHKPRAIRHFKHPVVLEENVLERPEIKGDESPVGRLLQQFKTLQVPVHGVETSISLQLETMSRLARVDCNSGGLSSRLGLAASTSGRVDIEFWDDRRKGRSHMLSPPTGVLYVVDPRENCLAFSELEPGKKLEDSVAIGEKHGVSMCFEQGSLGKDKSLWMSTSHKLDANNMLATQYANNLEGGAEFTVNSSHSRVPASRLSTCFNVTSLGDPTLEVELEQEKETKKVTRSIFANLRTGGQLLQLRLQKKIRHNVALSNAYITNLRGQHSVRLEASMPILVSGNISNCFTTDLQESHELCIKAQHWFGDQNTIETSFVTNLHQSNQIRAEAKHVVQGTREVVLKLVKDMHGTMQFKVTTCHTRQHNCWEWTYRKASGEAQSLDMNWKHEAAQDKYISLRASLKDWTCDLYTELCISL